MGLFGGSNSSSDMSLHTSTAAKMISDAVMQCKGNNIVRQNVTISGDGNLLDGVSFVQALKISTSCSQDLKRDTKLQQQVASELEQKTAAQGTAILSVLGGSSADTSTRIRTDVQSMFADSTLTEIINAVNLEQGLTISGNNNILRNYSQEQTTDLLTEGIQKAINNLSSVQAINQKIAQETTAVTTNPISEIIDSTFNGLAGIMKYWAIIVIGVAALGLFFFRDTVKKVFCQTTPFCGDPEESGDDDESVGPPPYEEEQKLYDPTAPQEENPNLVTSDKDQKLYAPDVNNEN